MVDLRDTVPADVPAPGPGEYEWRMLNLPRGLSLTEARNLLVNHAEYGEWELAQVRLFTGGARQVWLRRRIIRVVRTA